MSTVFGYNVNKSIEITSFAQNTWLRCEVDDVTLLDFTVGQVHFEPQLIAHAWLEVSYQSAGGRIVLSHLEHAAKRKSGYYGISVNRTKILYLFKMNRIELKP